jgi:hypothetical protein
LNPGASARHQTAGFRRLYFRAIGTGRNYRILTPPKKKTEFRKQKTEVVWKQGVKTRQFILAVRRRKARRRKPAVR